MALHIDNRSPVIRGRGRSPRLHDTAVWPTAVAFTGCLTVVAVLGALAGTDPRLGLAALAGVAVLAARRTRLAQAGAIGAIAWLFDDGFVADALHRGYEPGVLHWNGSAAAALGLLLVVSAVSSVASGTRT